MREPDRHSASRAWSWRHAIAKSGLQPITRLVLHTLGLKMDETGGSCYPPISELVDLTGLDKKTVLKHLDLAEQNGWIEVTQHGFRGQKWKRNEYVARWPGRDLTGSPTTVSDEEGGGAVPPPSQEKVVEMVPEGGGNGSQKVVEQLHQDKILPANSPINSPAAVAEEGVSKRVDRKKIEREFTLWYASWGNGDVDFARNAWFAISDEERAECIRRTPDILKRVKKSDRVAAAVFIKGRQWNDFPEEEASPARGIAKVCGKLWVGTRLRALSKEPTGFMVITGFDAKRIERGEVSREEVLRKKRLEHGWPLVTEMRELAQKSEPFVTTLDLLPHVEDFRTIERGSAVYEAWVDLHDRRGWPFIDRPAQYLWFPPIDESAENLDEAVENALVNFLSKLNEAGDDDAA